ncbi:MAG: AAA family ATPase [Thermoplasmata archaeon]|nr:AAA family ATPase [Thermoplasmata archaeon]
MPAGSIGGTSAATASMEEAPFVGRSGERSRLVRALEEIRSGRGGTWLIEGPAGMGKTRLARWLQEAAESEEFEVLWGHALKEVSSAFFVFQQVLRPLLGPGTSGKRGEGPLPSPLPSFLVVEEERPRWVLEGLRGLASSAAALLVVRDRALLRSLPPIPGLATLVLARGERPDESDPRDLDRMGALLADHLRKAHGNAVVLTGLEYLSSQAGGPALRHLVQFLRDVAEETGGHLLLSINPAAFDTRELSLLEGDSDVLRSEGTLDEPRTPLAPAARMLEYLEALERAANRAPQLVFLDDLQWADAASLRTLRFLARNLQRSRVGFVATLRTEERSTLEEGEERPLEETLEGMSREGRVERLRLSGLREEESLEVARGLFGEEMSAEANHEAFAQLQERTEGNPFFVLETLRHLSSEGLVRRDRGALRVLLPGADTSSRPEGPSLVPESLRRLLARQLARLSAEERDLLGWGCVAGSEFDLAPLSSVLSASPERLLPLLDALVRQRRVLEEVPDRPQGYRFVHPLLWEVSLEDLGAPDRQARAMRLAEWWGEHRPHDIVAVARLYHDGRDPSRGLPWVRRAIERAQEDHAAESVELYHRWLQELLEGAGAARESRLAEGLAIAVQLHRSSGPSRPLSLLFERLVAMDGPGPLRLLVLARRAQAFASLDPEVSEKRLADLRGELQGLPPHPDVAALVALTDSARRSDAHDYTRSLALADEALGLLGPEAETFDRCMALYLKGWALTGLGRLDEVGPWLERLRALAEPSGSVRLLNYCTSLGGALAWSQGDLPRAEAIYESEVRQSRQVGDYVRVAVALLNVCLAQDARGELGKAVAAAQEAQLHADRFDFPFASAFGKLEEATAMLHQGRAHEARPLLRSALDFFERAKLAGQVARCHLALAEVALAEGTLDEALREVETARDPSVLPADEQYMPPIIGAWVQEARGSIEEARGMLERAEKSARRSAGPFPVALVRASLGRWLSAHGAPSEGERISAEAEAELDRCGVLREAWVRRWPPPPAVGPEGLSKAGS